MIVLNLFSASMMILSVVSTSSVETGSSTTLKPHQDLLQILAKFLEVHTKALSSKKTEIQEAEWSDFFQSNEEGILPKVLKISRGERDLGDSRRPENKKDLNFFSSTDDLQSDSLDLVEQLTSLGSDVTACVKMNASLLCHVPMKLRFEEILDSLKQGTVSGQESPEIQTLISNLFYVFNMLEKNRKQVCVSDQGQRSFCSEEELSVFDPQISYETTFDLLRRLEKVEDRITDIVQGRANLTSNLRSYLQFDIIAEQIRATPMSPDNLSRAEILIQALSQSMEKLELIRKDICQNDRRQDYCNSHEIVTNKQPPSSSTGNFSELLRSHLHNLKQCKNIYAENPSCFLHLRESLGRIYDRLNVTFLSPDESREIGRFQDRIAGVVRRIEVIAHRECQKTTNQDFCAAVQENQDLYPKTDIFTGLQTKPEVTIFPETQTLADKHVLEPEEEDWEGQDLPKAIDRNSDGRDFRLIIKEYSKLREAFANGIRANLYEIDTQLSNCWDKEGVNHKKYFSTKKSFKDLTEKLDDYQISIRFGSKAAKIFEEAAEKIWQIERISKAKCDKNKITDDICLLFNFTAFTIEVARFCNVAKDKLKSLIFIETSDKDIFELNEMLERSKVLHSMGETFLLTADDSRKVFEDIEDLQRMLSRRIAETTSSDEQY